MTNNKLKTLRWAASPRWKHRHSVYPGAKGAKGFILNVNFPGNGIFFFFPGETHSPKGVYTYDLEFFTVQNEGIFFYHFLFSSITLSPF